MTVETREIHIITKECIRTKDPNNHSDTETGTLSSQDGPTKSGRPLSYLVNFFWGENFFGGGAPGVLTICPFDEKLRFQNKK